MRIRFLLVAVLLVLVFSFTVNAAELPVFNQPVVVTTCGQSPGALMVKMICQQSNIDCTQNDLLTVQDLKAGNFKTLIITMGTSGKGMGAAGTNMNEEEKRISSLIKTAKELNIKLIGAHVEGMSRRVDENDARSIEIVLPDSEALLVKNASNEDGYFAEKSEELEIPAVFFEKNMDMGAAINKFFDVN